MTCEKIETISNYRRYLPQVLAALAKNLLTFNLGVYFGFPSLVIPSLLGVSTELNPDETLRLSPHHASWLTSSSLVPQLIGCLTSCWITDVLGARKTMLLVNIPHAIAWLTLANAESLTAVGFGFTLLGFGFGMMTAAILAYVGEICEPSIRGILLALAGVASTSGVLTVFSLGALLSWRQVAWLCAFTPIAAFVALIFVPEPPIWLLSRNKTKLAMQSLQWLRGWVSPQAVYDELHTLQLHSEYSNSCRQCLEQSVKCYHPPPTFRDKIANLKRRRTLKPLILVVLLHMFMEFCGMFAWRPYIIQILQANGVPMDANKTTVYMSVAGIFSNMILLFVVKFTGKRKIYIYTSFTAALICFTLSAYGYILLPPGWSSFDESLGNVSTLQSIHEHVGYFSYLAFVLFVLLQFCTSISVSSMPHIFSGEVFPYTSRVFLVGLTSACGHLFGSISTKLYYNVESYLSLPGAIGFYGCISLIGCLIMFLVMPETEGRSLEDIETHYADDDRSILSTKIMIQSKNKTIDELQHII